jgi:hypothetical protein
MRDSLFDPLHKNSANHITGKVFAPSAWNTKTGGALRAVCDSPAGLARRRLMQAWAPTDIATRCQHRSRASTGHENPTKQHENHAAIFVAFGGNYVSDHSTTRQPDHSTTRPQDHPTTKAKSSKP